MLDAYEYMTKSERRRRPRAWWLDRVDPEEDCSPRVRDIINEDAGAHINEHYLLPTK